MPPLTLTASALEGDSTFNIYTDSLGVNVGYSPIDSIQPFHDIKTILPAKDEWPWWAWALIALAVILLIAGIYFLVKFLKRKKTTNSLFSSKLSPYEEAMESISLLEKQQLDDHRSLKEYHAKLTEIFKRYLSRKSNAYKMHLTSDEVLMELNEWPLTKEQIGGFANAIRMGNAVKFAQYIPPSYDNQNCLLRTKELIISIEDISNKKTESDI